jgi:hypothetical protein
MFKFVRRVILLAVFLAFIGAGFMYAYNRAKNTYIPLNKK